jgi:hypothetical protein
MRTALVVRGGVVEHEACLRRCTTAGAMRATWCAVSSCDVGRANSVIRGGDFAAIDTRLQ